VVKPPSRDRSSKSVVCHRCGGPHKAPECTFQKAKHHKCRKVGHIAKVCHSKAKPSKSTAAKAPQQQHSLMNSLQILNLNALSMYGIHYVTVCHSDPIVAIKKSKLQLILENPDLLLVRKLLNNYGLKNNSQQ